MNKLKIILTSALFLLVIILGNFTWQIYWKSPQKNAPVVPVEIRAGESVAALAADLKDKKIINNKWLLKRYLRKNGLDTKLQVGSFNFQPGMSIKSVALALGDPHVAFNKLLFKEGDTISDFGRVLEYNGIAQAEEIQELAGYSAVNYCVNKGMPRPKDFSADYDFLTDKPKCIGLEGYLFPDTYFFAKDATVEQIAKKMLDNFGKKLTPELRAEIARQEKTIHEIITMASLIEAEAKSDAERRQVSDVLWRRLSVGMGLQLDSTVNYLTGNDKPAVSLEETAINSLYNTYKYRGLPPGPINSPGMSAILAAIYPEKNDYWFFLADKEGIIHFGKTLEEHNRLKYQYLK